MASIASISGLASGIQWQDLIDQIMAQETARRVTPYNTQITLQQQRSEAWTAYQGILTRLSDASKALRDGTAFGSYQATAGLGTGGRALVSVATNAAAAPGSYKVEVLGLASAEKLSGNVVTSATDALGIEGEFSVNGRAITIAADDSLSVIRDRINASNSGTSPSRVSATILSTANGEHRLVLSSDTAGAAGMELVDGDDGALRQLGLVDGSLTANTTASGGTASRRISSVTTAIAAALGVTMPQPSTVRVGEKTITVDLTQDSLSAIAAKIQAAGIPAHMVEEVVDGRTSYRLEVEGTVSSDGTADSQRAIELLGFQQPGRSAVSQVVAGEQAWTTAGGAATTSSLLTDVQLADGGSLGVGNVITIRGTRGDGVAVGGEGTQLTIQPGTTVDDLLRQVESAYGAARGVTASIGADGTIRVTDSQGGESKLSLSLSVASAPGEPEAALLGRVTTQVTGRLRELAAGSDAVIRVDGNTITRGSNTISDVISGVTLSLQNAEPGTVVDVSVARDDDATLKAIQQFVSAYNDAATFVKTQSAQGAALAFNGTLRSTMAQLTSVLLTDLDALPPGAAFDRATLVGVSLNRTGTLEVDTERLRGVLASSNADVRTLFGADGLGGLMAQTTERLVRSGDGVLATQQDSISTSIASLEHRVTAAEARIELRREAMLKQFSAMEAALSRMQAQGNWLTQQISALPTWSSKD